MVKISKRFFPRIFEEFYNEQNFKNVFASQAAFTLCLVCDTLTEHTFVKFEMTSDMSAK